MMATTKSAETSVVDLLNNLIELDYDAVEAYKAAIARVESLNDSTQLAVFVQDHQRHIVNLTALVRKRGAEPKDHGDLKQILTKGRVVLSGLIGDKLVLAAMKANEDDTNAAYERALEHPSLPPEVRLTLEQNLADERRHRAWIEGRLAEAEGVVSMEKKD
jgi:uncharacterized protein (TIGR02284 family)